ncbi:MAG: DUF1624 domain-containing protein [Saprospiraceae bacterium]|nr:DUF1624 domain-containing protein [Saprospiraceae bacterium]
MKQASSTKNRLISIDTFRGFTILTMILVNTPGSWSSVYPPLLHADWHGFTIADYVFPAFVFISGVSMYFSFKHYNGLTKELNAKLLKRIFWIFAIGLMLNAFPFFNKDYHQLRIMGVLQRTALAYGLGAYACILLTKRQLIYLSSAVLLGYWFILWQFGGANPYSLNDNICAKIDNWIIGENHLWHGKGIPFDPEGLLSTLPATISLILGYLIGSLFENKNKLDLIKQMIPLGLVCLFIGFLWNFLLPINKPLWTSSYVVYTTGINCILLALFIWILDIKSQTWFSKPFIVYGINPLLAFIISGILVKISFLFQMGIDASGKPITLYKWIYENWYVPIWGNLNGSLMFAISFIILCWLLLYLAYKKRWILKV